jgi:hypothetical protein
MVIRPDARLVTKQHHCTLALGPRSDLGELLLAPLRHQLFEMCE